MAEQIDRIAGILFDSTPRPGRIDQNCLGAHERVHAASALASSRSSAAPFSAIIMVGALVLPEVIVGIAEASITRRRSMPATRRRSSSTAVRSLDRPDFVVPTGWKVVAR